MATPKPSHLPPLRPKPPSLSPTRRQILHAENALAYAEAALRRQRNDKLHLEALGDAYLARLAGDRLDNVHRAIMTYAHACRRERERVTIDQLARARLLAKLGNAWFTRLHVTLRIPTIAPSAVDTHAHLMRALRPLNDCIAIFDTCQEWRSVPVHCRAYLDAMLCRGLVYDRLYQTIDAHVQSPGVGAECVPVEEPLKKKVRRRMYVNRCIASLETSLAGNPMPHTEVKSSWPLQIDYNSSSAAAQNKYVYADRLYGVKRARAVMCLARAYSNLEDDRVLAAAKALVLLRSVEGILQQGRMEGKEQLGPPQFGAEAEIAQIQEDAKAQITALSAGEGGAGSRCLVC